MSDSPSGPSDRVRMGASCQGPRQLEERDEERDEGPMQSRAFRQASGFHPCHVQHTGS